MSAVLTEPRTHRSPGWDGFLALDLLKPSKTNPRKHFDPKTLSELATSIAEHGVLQPILAREINGAIRGRPFYEIVAGERRWRASKEAKVPRIPVIVRDMTDFQVLELQVIENLQRDDLHPLEEAEGYQALMRKPNGLQGYANADELAARIGKSRSYVFGRLKLCALVEPAKKAFIEGDINASTALLIARMPPAIQVDATKKILQGWGGEPASYRQARDLLEKEFMLKLGSAPFKITDAELLPSAGSCKSCGKRTGANPDLFEDIKSGDVCTDPPCFAKKKAAHQAQVIAIAKETGREVITGAEAKKALPNQHSNEIKGFVSLGDAAHSVGIYDKPGKQIGQLLGKEAPQTILFENPHTKELIEVVRRDDALRVLQDKGALDKARLSPASQAQRKAELKTKADTLWRTTVGQRAVAAVIDPKFDDADLHSWLMPEVALAMWDRLDFDTEKAAMKLLGWATLGEGRYSAGRQGALAERVKKLTAAQLDQLFVAMAIAGQLRGSLHSTLKPERLLRVAKGLSVDADAIKAELDAAAKAKEKKPAAKKAAKAKKAAPIGSSGAKYRNPATGDSWSGRGLQPKWLKVQLERGKTLADFEVHQAAEKKPAGEFAPIKLANGAVITDRTQWPFPTGPKAGG